MSEPQATSVEAEQDAAAKGPLAALARWILRRWGWTIVGRPPAEPKYVMIGSPHTSYWDTPVMLLCAAHFGIPLRWLVKSQAYRPPFRGVLRLLRGIPLDRSGGRGAVAQIAEVFRAQERLALALAPDGTRRYCDYWRSGFYHIAREAGVPVVFGFQDWGTRRVGIGPTLRLSGEVRADMDQVRAFYSPMIGKYPEGTSRIRLREEDA
jgi:1-acyl-sn-glycerol-3-phosphate acyltransferase